jgi:hypothetical protein
MHTGSRGDMLKLSNYLFDRKEFGLCRYWPTNAELLALTLNMAQF